MSPRRCAAKRSVERNDVARRCEDERRSNALADWVDGGAEVDLSTRHTSLWVDEPARPAGGGGGGELVTAPSRHAGRPVHRAMRRFVHLLRCRNGRFVDGTREGGAAWAWLASAALRPFSS